MTLPHACPPTHGPQFEVLEPRLLLDVDPEAQVQVDYLIIAADAFFSGGNPCEPIEQLKEWKQLKGFRTAVATSSHAQSTDQGIANYILHGYKEEGGEWWDTPPQYVLLVGGDDGDNILEDGEVPAASGQQLMHPTLFHVTDNPYANLDGEYYSSLDLAIGRIPVSTVDDVTIAINKILAYEKTWGRFPYIP